jgi:hypothetical protein
MAMDVPTLGFLTVAGMLASAPFGLPMQQIALGTGFAVLGVIGRAAFELQKTSEGSTDGIRGARIWGWMGSGLIGAPFISTMYLIVLQLLHVKADGVVSFGFLFFGFTGPRMLSWLLNTCIGQLNKRLGLNIPTWGPPTPNPEKPG